MRLWHKALIKALPQQHLVSQWRELSAIAGAIQKNGTPNHVLVFISYAYYLREEMTKRKIRTMNSVWEKIISLKPDYTILPIEEVYKNKMDKEYFIICYYNLYEKYKCGMFGDEDWNNIMTTTSNY